MRILIFGTGAMATLLGGRLARQPGHEVTLVGTWAEALARIAREGVEVAEPGETWRAHPSAAAITSSLPAHDAALVLVKSWQTATIAAHVARACRATAGVFTLQNGAGNDAVLAGALGRPVGIGVARLGATLVGPARVRSTGPGGVALAGAGAGDLAHALTASGTPARVVGDIGRHVWHKLVGNAAVNALTALHGVPNGALLERAELRSAFEAAAREAGDVARASGIDLGADPIALAAALVQATASNRSSMLQDLERGAPTEIEALNGAVARAGRALGVPTPVNDALCRAVRARSASAA